MGDQDDKCPICFTKVEDLDECLEDHILGHSCDFDLGYDMGACPFCYKFFLNFELPSHSENCKWRNGKEACEIPTKHPALSYTCSIMSLYMRSTRENRKPTSEPTRTLAVSVSDALPSSELNKPSQNYESDVKSAVPRSASTSSETASDSDLRPYGCTSNFDILIPEIPYSPTRGGLAYIEDEDDDLLNSSIFRAGNGFLSPVKLGTGGCENNEFEEPEAEKPPEADVDVLNPNPRARIALNFRTNEPAPTSLSSEQALLLEAMLLQRCALCNYEFIKGSRGPRKSGNPEDMAQGAEETLLRHFVLNHPDDLNVKAILALKSHKIVENPNDSAPPCFLFTTQKGQLVCSSCCTAKFQRFYSLKYHFLKCATSYPKPVKDGHTITLWNSTSCPIDCGTHWKPSDNFPVWCSSLFHLMSVHTFDREAYRAAMEIRSAVKSSDVFPFMDIEKSWAETATNKKMHLVCSKCDESFASMQSFVNHSRRTHIDVSCPLGCKIPTLPFCSPRFRSDRIIRWMECLIHLLKHLIDDDTEKVNKIVEYLESLRMAVDERVPIDIGRSTNKTVELKKLFICTPSTPSLKYGSVFISVSTFVNYINSLSNIKASEKEYIKLLCEAQKAPKKAKDTSRRKSAYEHCNICSKLVAGSSTYCYSYSMLFHYLKLHKNSSSVKDKIEEWHDELSEKFPFGNIREMYEKNQKLPTTSQNFSFVCNRCSYTADCAKTEKVVVHARRCDVNNNRKNVSVDSSEPLTCPLCPLKMKESAFVSPQFLMFGHFVRRHCTPKNLKLYTDTWGIDFLSTDFPYLNPQESFKTRSFCCSICQKHSTDLYIHVKHSSACHAGQALESVTFKKVVSTEVQQSSATDSVTSNRDADSTVNVDDGLDSDGVSDVTIDVESSQTAQQEEQNSTTATKSPHSDAGGDAEHENVEVERNVLLKSNTVAAENGAEALPKKKIMKIRRKRPATESHNVSSATNNAPLNANGPEPSDVELSNPKRRRSESPDIFRSSSGTSDAPSSSQGMKTDWKDAFTKYSMVQKNLKVKIKEIEKKKIVDLQKQSKISGFFGKRREK